MAPEYRLTGADRPNVPIPALNWLDRAWRRRVLVVAALAVLAAVAALIFGRELWQTGVLDQRWKWPVLAAGAVLSLGGVVLSFVRVDSVPRVGMMEERSTAAKGLRRSVKRASIPENLALLRVQDYMAVEMVQYAWPMLPALAGMILVLVALWTVAPAVIVALLLVAVWAVIRFNGTAVGRRYYRLRRH